MEKLEEAAYIITKTKSMLQLQLNFITQEPVYWSIMELSMGHKKEEAMIANDGERVSSSSLV